MVMLKRILEPPGFSCALALSAVLASLQPSWRPFVLATVTLLIGLPLVFFVHELGHGVVALAQGYRFRFLAVGPLWIEAASRGVRIRANRSWAYVGGLFASTPDRVSRERLAAAHRRVLLAGPLASLIAGAGLLALGGESLSLPAAIVAAASIGTGLAALIPSRQGELVSDGLGYWTLRRGGPEAERYLRRILAAAEAMSSAASPDASANASSDAPTQNTP